MKIFFDNCTSPVMASTLHGYIQRDGHEAYHIKDMPCGANASDIEWIEMLSKDNNEWIVVTGDARIRKNNAEKLAYRKANLRGFVISSWYKKTPMNKICATLILRWPEMEQLVKIVAPPALFELPLRGQIRQMPF